MFNISDGIIESLLGLLTSFRRISLDFVQEDGIIKAQAQADGVGRSKVRLGRVDSFFVSILGILLHFFDIFLGVLRDVTVIVSLHLPKKNFALTVRAFFDDIVFNEVQNLFAVGIQFFFDLFLILFDK